MRPTLLKFLWLVLAISLLVNAENMETRRSPDSNQSNDQQSICEPQKNDCKNGGTCLKHGDSYICTCLEGTSGKFCETVQNCTDPKFCRHPLEADCYFNQTEKRAACKCYDEKKAFDHVGKECKRFCDGKNIDCENGGICVKDGNYGFCKCLSGTRGDHCEEIEKCYICGDDAECYFDVSKKMPGCKCKDENDIFVQNRGCKRPCSTSQPCQNGGTCVKFGNSSFCSCLDGTSEDFCERVYQCRDFCGESSTVDCYFDVDNRKPACRCLDASRRYDAENKVCKRACSTSHPCENGGSCVEVGNFSMCACLDGSIGDYCQDVDRCETYSNPFCWQEKDGKDPLSECYFDVENRKPACKCAGNAVYDAVKFRCRRTCDAFNNNCENGGTCTRQGEHNFCSCPKGTLGDFCENSRDCEDIYFCGKGSDAQCYFDQMKGQSACKCTDNRKVYDANKRMCILDCSALNNKCENGGMCIQDGNTSYCSCLPGTSGAVCETIGECKEDYLCGSAWDVECYYDAEKLKASCRCRSADAVYDPKRRICANGVTSECDPNPCQNGGTCVALNNNVICLCKESYRGDYCESHGEPPNINIFIISTLAVLTLGVLLSIVLAGCALRGIQKVKSLA